MNIKEIIDRLAELEGSGLGPVWNTHRKALREAIDKLRTHQDNQPNESLTLEELREMDGRPVYVVDRVYPPYSGWWIIGWEDGSCVLVAAKRRGTQYIVQDYGIGWVAYRRLPKEEA